MKLQKNTNTLISNSGGDGQGLGIEMSSKAAMILSGLYVNKVRAILREIGCNAFDSHVEAGKSDVPFEVTLPTDFEPWLKIRDFGMGLSPDQVVNIFTIYFKSTKSDSNDIDGAMGIGSKSPFAYTDQFNVTSIYDGVSYSYQLYKDHNDFPVYKLIAENETEEENGVTVTIPVKSSDIFQFRSEASKVYQWFETPPTIIYGDQIERVEIEGDYQYEFSRYPDGVYNGFYALMGNVLYEIYTKEIPDLELSVLSHIANRKPVIIKFDRGELNFLPSREAISFNRQTTQNVKDKLESIDNELKSYVQNEIDKLGNIRELYYNDVKNDFLFNFFESKLTWNGLNIKSYEVSFEELLEEAYFDHNLATKQYANRIRNDVAKIDVRGYTIPKKRRNIDDMVPWLDSIVFLVREKVKIPVSDIRKFVGRTYDYDIIIELSEEFLDDVTYLYQNFNTKIVRYSDVIDDEVFDKTKYIKHREHKQRIRAQRPSGFLYEIWEVVDENGEKKVHTDSGRLLTKEYRELCKEAEQRGLNLYVCKTDFRTIIDVMKPGEILLFTTPAICDKLIDEGIAKHCSDYEVDKDTADKLRLDNLIKKQLWVFKSDIGVTSEPITEALLSKDRTINKRTYKTYARYKRLCKYTDFSRDCSRSTLINLGLSEIDYSEKEDVLDLKNFRIHIQGVWSSNPLLRMISYSPSSLLNFDNREEEELVRYINALPIITKLEDYYHV